MTTPHRCPICHGAMEIICGNYSQPLESRFDLPPLSLSAGTHRCHVCGGKGIVWEPQEPLPAGLVPPESEPPPTEFLGVNIIPQPYQPKTTAGDPGWPCTKTALPQQEQPA